MRNGFAITGKIRSVGTCVRCRCSRLETRATVPCMYVCMYVRTYVYMYVCTRIERYITPCARPDVEDAGERDYRRSRRRKE